MKTTQQQPVTETLETLRSVSNDIRDIDARLKGGIEDDKMVLLNYRIMMEAIETRDSTIRILEDLFCREITLQDLGIQIN
jgi:hypothetical protein